MVAVLVVVAVLEVVVVAVLEVVVVVATCGGHRG